MDDQPSPSDKKFLRKPEWLRIKLPSASEYAYLKEHLNRHHLHTICESGNCPNLGECWAARTATFMILGDICTRNCKFCNVHHGSPLPQQSDEPERIAEAVTELGIKHCVLTSVTRDDLDDEGAGIWHDTIRAIKNAGPHVTIEALIPDFSGSEQYISQVIAASPEVIAHNLETVKRLTPAIRVKAQYDRSLGVIRFLSDQGVRSKSGLMVGLGETDAEVKQSLDDLRWAGCRVVTIGQYLQPSRKHWPVDRYVTPEQFEIFREYALSIGFEQVESAPLVRSSYHAGKHVISKS